MKKILVSMFLLVLGLCLVGCESTLRGEGEYKLTVIDDFGYLVKPLDKYYKAGEEIEVHLAFLSGPSVGININGEYISENAETKHVDGHPVITFIMPDKNSILYTTMNGLILKDCGEDNHQWDEGREIEGGNGGYVMKYICELCGESKEETITIIPPQESWPDDHGTENEKCQGHLVITNTIPVPITGVTFKDGSELEEFIKNYENFNKWVYMNEIIKNNEVINVYNESYRFNYDEEKDGKYINPYLTISFALYSEALGTDTGDDYVLYHSISFLINIRPNDLKDDISYKLCKYSNNENMYNNVVLIYSGDNVIGEAYYYTKLDVTENWITDFLNENLLVPIKIK